jgi:TatD DNase family protein
LQALITIDVHSHYPGNARKVVLQQDNTPNAQCYSVGIHPVLDADHAFEKLELLPALLRGEGCVALGESGLDKNSSLDIADQMKIFERQAEMAADLGLPVIIHCVGRWNELEQLLKKKSTSSPPWIIHGFRKMKLAEKFLSLGAYLSFGEAVLFDKTVQEALPGLPFDRIFLETDDKIFDIRNSYEKLAALKNISVQAVSTQLENNFRTVFQASDEMLK